MPLFTDQTGQSVILTAAPKRIISIVPSQTELLYDLGLRNEVIGITKFCVHPSSWFTSKERIGGTKSLHIEKIKALAPDLVIANKEENSREEVEALKKHCAVWVSDIKTLEDALDMIRAIGDITGTQIRAGSLTNAIRSGFDDLSKRVAILQAGQKGVQDLSAAYLIWRNPFMAAGNDSFIHDMMCRCGFNNVLKDIPRYPVITLAELQAENCSVLLLASEPYPFKEKHIRECRKELPFAKILLVDGEMFSWYGSRLLHAPAYFKQLCQQLWAL